MKFKTSDTCSQDHSKDSGIWITYQ